MWEDERWTKLDRQEDARQKMKRNKEISINIIPQMEQWVLWKGNNRQMKESIDMQQWATKGKEMDNKRKERIG